VELIAGAPDNQTGAPAPVSAARPRILIVEDEPALLRALRINLRARSYEVITRRRGARRWPKRRSIRRTPSFSTWACLTWTVSR
jgi:hypothetical protein